MKYKENSYFRTKEGKNIMTIEEMFYYFDDKYGDEFNWGIIPYKASHFVEELKKEVGNNDPMFQKDICAVARSYSADDVLFLVDDEKDTYRIYHLTYSHKEDKFLRFVEMENIEKVKEFLERQFIDKYL